MSPLQNNRVLVLPAHLRIKWLFQLEINLYLLNPVFLAETWPRQKITIKLSA
jgi:hypothetical protein